MKYVVCDIKNKAINGIISSLYFIEKSVSVWNKQNIPTLDMFDIEKPDVLIIDAVDIDDSIIYALKKYPKTQLWLFGNYINKNILDLNKPDIFISYMKINGNMTVPHIKLDVGANIANLMGGNYNKKLESDSVAIIDINTNIDYLKRFVQTNHIHKIFGYSARPLNCPEYLGRLNNNEVKDVIASTKFGIDIDGDMWPNFALYRKPCITSDKTCKVYPTFSSLKEFGEILSANIDKDTESAYNLVMNERNYLKTTANIFNLLGNSIDEGKCLNSIKNLAS